MGLGCTIAICVLHIVGCCVTTRGDRGSLWGSTVTGAEHHGDDNILNNTGDGEPTAPQDADSVGSGQQQQGIYDGSGAEQAPARGEQ